jgi:hypothetical protein
VDTFMQRYPASDGYERILDTSMRAVRYGFWRWVAPTLVSACVFLPIVSTLAEVVRERQYKMKDLLEISGLMNASYWFSYMLVMFISCQIAL